MPAVDPEEIRPELNRILSGLETSQGLDLVLWLGTLALGLAAGVWIALGAVPADRAAAIRPLWPFALVWVFALLIRSSMSARAREQVVQAEAMVAVAIANARARAAALARAG